MTDTTVSSTTTTPSTQPSPHQNPQTTQTTPEAAPQAAATPAATPAQPAQPAKSVDILAGLLKPGAASETPTTPEPAAQTVPEVPTAAELTQDPDRMARIEQMLQEMNKPKEEAPNPEATKTYTEADWWAYNTKQQVPGQILVSDITNADPEVDMLPTLQHIAVAANADHLAATTNAMLALAARIEQVEAQLNKANPVVDRIVQTEKQIQVQQQWLTTLYQAVPDYDSNPAKSQAFEQAYVSVINTFGGAEKLGTPETNPDFYLKAIAVASKMVEGIDSTTVTTGPVSKQPATPKPVYTTGVPVAPASGNTHASSVGLIKSMLQKS